MTMKKKAEELIDKLNDIAHSQSELTDTVTSFEVGDIVSVTFEGTNYAAVVESMEGEDYYVRVQAVAGDEFEATDKVIKVSVSELSAYEKPKSFGLGDAVQWKSEAGLTIGEIVGEPDESSSYPVEVFAQDEKAQYEPTFVTVLLPPDVLTKTDTELKRPKGQIMVKMSDITMDYDETKRIGVLEGDGSWYGQVDLGGDRVNKGAYSQTITHKNGRVPLFIDHGWDMETFMGIAFLEDSDTSLKVRAEMPMEATDVKDVFFKTKFATENGMNLGFSIGYDAVKSRLNPDGTRDLLEIALHEISITPFPMDTNAKILSARSKRIAYKAMQTKWATPIIDAPVTVTGNQDEQGAEALVELKSLLTTKRTKL
jgi:HK97 family phage prohead protease